MNMFNDLKSSLEEAVEISKGNAEASRQVNYKTADVNAIRSHLQVSQIEFAQALGTSVDTVKSWESKRRNPTGLAAKVLLTIEEEPTLYHALAQQSLDKA